MGSDSAIGALDIRIEAADFPCERLRVRTLSGQEAISRLFDLDLEVVCLDREGLDSDAMAGATVSLVFERDGLEIRRLHGMIAEVDDLLVTRADHRSYRLRVVPRAFRLTMIRTQDIFIDLTVPEIIQKKLAQVDLGHDTELRLAGDYPKREFVVQYDESDFAFIARLAEHLGVSFHFDHSSGRDVIVFTDHPGGFRASEAAEKLTFRGRGERNDVYELQVKKRLIPSFYVVQDYNYRKPQLDITSSFELPGGYPGGVIEHGGHFKTPEEGQALAQIRAEERQAGQVVYTGASDLPELTAGARCTLDGHPDLGPTGLLLTEVTHQASLVVSGAGDGRPTYVSTFRAAPSAVAYRPPRVTPKPTMSGVYTGVIDPGPPGLGDGKYARLDDQGRYTVRFLFDTTALGERPASRPVRMLQNHAGENYGTHFPLRPGVEVLIVFVNGDPDRPVIVGAVPNPLKPSPVTSRDAGVHRVKTASGIMVDMVEDT